MSKRKLFFSVICVFLSIVLISADLNALAVMFTYETQYDYEEADIAWLTDLVIKEDMTTAEGMAQRVELVPMPEYPYTETPESFKEEVEYFISLYSLEPGSQRSSYLYLFEILNSKSEYVSGDVSDADIREYLEGIGIKYPSTVSAEELIMARVLFAAFASGSLSGSAVSGGVSLEAAVVTHLANLTGMNMEDIRKWMPENSVLSLDEYILAASKLALWSNGYDVSIDTPEDEVFRLVAVMTVKAQGISVDSSLGFNELKNHYIASLIGKKYSVQPDSKKLADAVNNGTAAFYILQLLGKKGGLSIREDNASYEDAFMLVAENTGCFDVETDEFYADIYEYSATLSVRNSNLWIYPTAYATNSSYNVIVSVNGVAIKNNYYNEISVDPDMKEQDLIITVTASGGGKSSKCTYTVHITQGTFAGVAGDEPVTAPGKEEPSFGTSDELVDSIFADLGISSYVSDILDRNFTSIPAGLSSVMSFIAPVFDEEQTGNEQNTETKNDEFFIAVLDDIGAVFDSEISGVPGLEVIKTLGNGADPFVAF